jgi:hypothetical protein
MFRSEPWAAVDKKRTGPRWVARPGLLQRLDICDFMLSDSS